MLSPAIPRAPRTPATTASIRNKYEWETADWMLPGTADSGPGSSEAPAGSDSGPDQEGSDVAAADASPDGDGGTVGTEQPDSDGTIGGVVAGVGFVGLLAVIDGTGYLLRRGFRVG